MNRFIPPLEAVIFDIDGTTLDTPQAQHSWLHHAAKTYGGVTEFPEFNSAFMQAYNAAYAEKKMPGLYAMVGVDYEANKPSIHKEFDIFNQTHHINAIAGMPTVILACKEMGVKIGVNTTKNMTSISAPLARAGLKGVFDAYVTEEDIHAQAERTGKSKVEFAKPHGYSAALIHEKLNVNATHTIAIEDETVGVRTYRNDGPHPYVIGVTWGFEPEARRLLEAGADTVIHEPEDLLAHIEMLRYGLDR